MFLPLHDRNPLKVIPLQFVTGALIGVSVVVFLWQLSLSEREAALFHFTYGLTPAVVLDHVGMPPDLAGVPAEVTILTAMFLHGGWMHLIGNMAYLWVFGDNVEDAMGHGRFLVFYLLCGVAASAVHVLAHPDSTSPLIGASGAVAGVMGAYVVLHPRVKILVLAFSRIPLYLPAYALLAGWLALQIYSGVSSTDQAVAWWAHVGGFVAGAIAVIAFKRADVPLLDRGIAH